MAQSKLITGIKPQKLSQEWSPRSNEGKGGYWTPTPCTKEAKKIQDEMDKKILKYMKWGVPKEVKDATAEKYFRWKPTVTNVEKLANLVTSTKSTPSSKTTAPHLQDKGRRLSISDLSIPLILICLHLSLLSSLVLVSNISIGTVLVLATWSFFLTWTGLWLWQRLYQEKVKAEDTIKDVWKEKEKIIIMREQLRQEKLAFSESTTAKTPTTPKACCDSENLLEPIRIGRYIRNGGEWFRENPQGLAMVDFAMQMYLDRKLMRKHKSKETTYKTMTDALGHKFEVDKLGRVKGGKPTVGTLNYYHDGTREFIPDKETTSEPMNSKYEKWLTDNIKYLDVDPTGQINFIDTPFANDQIARLKVQELFDKRMISMQKKTKSMQKTKYEMPQFKGTLEELDRVTSIR